MFYCYNLYYEQINKISLMYFYFNNLFTHIIMKYIFKHKNILLYYIKGNVFFKI